MSLHVFTVGDDLVKVFASEDQNSIWRYLHKFQDLYAIYEIDGRYPSGLFTALSMADSSVVGFYPRISEFGGERFLKVKTAIGHICRE